MSCMERTGVLNSRREPGAVLAATVAPRPNGSEADQGASAREHGLPGSGLVGTEGSDVNAGASASDLLEMVGEALRSVALEGWTRMSCAGLWLGPPG